MLKKVGVYLEKHSAMLTRTAFQSEPRNVKYVQL